MANSFLFGNQSSSQSKYLLEFKAGKMELSGTTVKPINKKGSVYLHKTDDNLMHFCWKDRTSGNVTDDLIIFPDDTEFKRVPQCTTGRVYVLKFKTSKKVYFYWLQEPSEEKDDEICNKVNDLLNNPSASTSRNSQSLTDLSESDIHNIINNVGSSQLMQILSGNRVGVNQVLQNLLNQSNSSSRMSRHSSSSSRSSGTKSSNNQDSSISQTTASSATKNSTISSGNTSIAQTTTSSATTGAGIQLSDLQNIISGLTVEQQQAKKEIVNVDLSLIVNSDALKNLLSNKEFMDKVKELLPDTSEVDKQQTLSEQVISTIESVQFKSALSSFSSALQSGLLGPVVQQFNLSDACVEAANKGDLEAFVKAMESSSVKKSETGDSDMPLE